MKVLLYFLTLVVIVQQIEIIKGQILENNGTETEVGDVDAGDKSFCGNSSLTRAMNNEGYCNCPLGGVPSGPLTYNYNDPAPACQNSLPDCSADKPATLLKLFVHKLRLCSAVSDFTTSGKYPDSYLYIDYKVQKTVSDTSDCSSKNIFYPYAKVSCEIIYDKEIILKTCPPVGLIGVLDLSIYAKKLLPDVLMGRAALGLSIDVKNKETAYKVSHGIEGEKDEEIGRVFISAKKIKLDPSKCSSACPEGTETPIFFSPCKEFGEFKKCTRVKNLANLELNIEMISICSGKLHIPQDPNPTFYIQAKVRLNKYGNLDYTSDCDAHTLEKSKPFEIKQGGCVGDVRFKLKYGICTKRTYAFEFELKNTLQPDDVLGNVYLYQGKISNFKSEDNGKNFTFNIYAKDQKIGVMVLSYTRTNLQ